MRMRAFVVNTILCLLFVLTGLQGTTFSAQTGFVSPEDSIPIPQGQEAGTWQGKHLSVVCKLTRDAEGMEFSGTINFSDKMVLLYKILNNFQLNAIFLDVNGRVLETKSIATARDTLDPVPFRVHLTMPAGATAMSFSYRGTALSGGKASDATNFWVNPIH
jgi:hypothetical protein